MDSGVDEPLTTLKSTTALPLTVSLVMVSGKENVTLHLKDPLLYYICTVTDIRWTITEC